MQYEPAQEPEDEQLSSKAGWLDQSAYERASNEQRLQQQAANLSERPAASILAPMPALPPEPAPLRIAVREGKEFGWAVRTVSSATERKQVAGCLSLLAELLIGTLGVVRAIRGGSSAFTDASSTTMLHTEALDLRLSYGRQLTAAQFFGLDFTKLSNPRYIVFNHSPAYSSYIIPFAQIEQLALFDVRYDPARGLYYDHLCWVKVWQRDHGNFIALVTDSPTEARVLCTVIAQEAKLLAWADFSGKDGGLAEVSYHFAANDLRPQLAVDLAQVSLRTVPTQVTGKLWQPGTTVKAQ